MALRLHAGSATDVGNVRATHQDALLILPGPLFPSPAVSRSGLSQRVAVRQLAGRPHCA